MCFQTPKEAALEKEHAGLTTLFPGQKRRVSHLCKQGKEVRPRFGIRAGSWREKACHPSLGPRPPAAGALSTACPAVPHLVMGTV